MIAGVVATLEAPFDQAKEVIEDLESIPGVEIGNVARDAHRVPVTIDLPDRYALEDTTRVLQECRGVAFVDVVFVHFEDSPDCAAAPELRRTDRS